jgi:sensor histidine kinase regulating citrate/malate metabolism
MSLFSKVSKFARSEQGKKAMDKAKDFANKPETKEKIEQVREKVSGKDKQEAAKAGDSATAATTPTTPPAGGTPPINDPDAAAVGEQPAQGNPPTAPS